MRFKLATDYAIRIVCQLCENDNKLSTASTLSEQLGITYLYFMKVTGLLTKAGLLISVQGCNGGYQLAKSPDEITLYDIVEVMEGKIIINRCLEEDGYCSRNATSHCVVHQYFNAVQSELVDMLKAKTIKAICKGQSSVSAPKSRSRSKEKSLK